MVLEKTRLLFAHLEHRIQQTAQPCGEEQVHELRIAVRRLDEALRLQGRPDIVKPLRRKLRKIFDRAGAVRDCDVASQLFAKSQLSNDVLTARLAGQREAAASCLGKFLSKCSNRLALPEIVETADPPPMPDFSTVSRKFWRLGRKAVKAKNQRSLHRFRIFVKRYRYRLELLEVNSALLETLSGIQGALGRVHDCRMARAMLRELKTNRALFVWLKKREQKARHGFYSQWKDLSAGRNRVR